MIFVDRPDGKRVKSLNPFQKILPYVMRGRNEAAVYFSMDIDIEPALRMVRDLNNREGGKKYGLFHVVIAAIVRVLEEKPLMNRFIMGKHVYARNYRSISFIVKKQLTEDARETDAKIFFDEGENFFTVAQKVDQAIARAQSEELSPDEKEMYFLASIPGGYRIATAVFRFLDRLNIAPAGMIKSDPLYTSVYVANLASLNLDAPFHHLYEWGTASVFVVMGRIERRKIQKKDGTEALHRWMNFKITVDERIGEGLYFARVLELFKRIMANPLVLLEEKGSSPITELSPSPAESVPVLF
ncbi:MAG: hypothetical protein N2Z76_02345 [Treponemataceae bacterium]|nr:hypothetical protein [Treponemataceae bacterium]